MPCVPAVPAAAGACAPLLLASSALAAPSLLPPPPPISAYLLPPEPTSCFRSLWGLPSATSPATVGTLSTLAHLRDDVSYIIGFAAAIAAPHNTLQHASWFLCLQPAFGFREECQACLPSRSSSIIPETAFAASAIQPCTQGCSLRTRYFHR